MVTAEDAVFWSRSLVSFFVVIAAVMLVYTPATGTEDSAISSRFTVFPHFPSLSPEFTEPALPASCYQIFKVILRNPALISRCKRRPRTKAAQHCDVQSDYCDVQQRSQVKCNERSEHVYPGH